MIKKLFKFIFKLILFVIILVLIVVGLTLFLISDKTDETPVDKYNDSITMDTVLSEKLSASLDNLGENYSIDLLFDEDSLNNLLYAFIKKTLNDKYDPKNGKTNDELMAMNLMDIPEGVPVVGGQPIAVKSIYGQINGEEITLNLTAKVSDKFRSRIHFTFKVETTEDSYVLNITELKFAKIKLSSNLVKKGLEKAGVEGIVNDKLNEMKLPFTFNLAELSLTATKEGFSDWVKDILKVDGNTKDMKSTFVGLFLDPSKDMVKFGMFDKGFGVKINLEDFKVEEKETVLDEAIKQTFDTETLMKSKAQTLIFNSLATSTDKYLSFSEVEMGQLIYTSMEGYKSFNIETELLAGVNFKFAVEGISFDINDAGTVLSIKIILNVNGLKTVAMLDGAITGNGSTEVKITLGDKIKIGSDLEIDSAFMTQMLEENFKTSEIMKYENGALVFTTDVFNTFLKEAMGSSDCPMSVEKLSFVKDNLNIYVQCDAISTQLAAATDMIKDALKSDFLDVDAFGELSTEEKAAVEELQAELGDIATKIDSDLTDEDTAELVDKINQLSPESQEIFFNQMQSSVSDPSVLEALYADMFK